MRVKFKYKNHEGKVEERDVDVVSLHFDFGNHPEYGYQPGWAIGGWDYSRDRDGSMYRSFYLQNVILDGPALKLGLMGPQTFKLLELSELCDPSHVIKLSPAEIQSKHDRVKWAEGLIRQLPANHDGRNSWLMNYGSREPTESVPRG